MFLFFKTQQSIIYYDYLNIRMMCLIFYFGKSHYSIININIVMVLWYASFEDPTLQKEHMTFGHVSTLEQCTRTKTQIHVG